MHTQTLPPVIDRFVGLHTWNGAARNKHLREHLSAKLPAKNVPVQSQSVLLCGRDRRLSGTRGLVLSTAGFVVVAAGNAAEAEHRIRTQHFNVLILCHSVPVAEAYDVLSTARSLQPNMGTPDPGGRRTAGYRSIK